MIFKEILWYSSQSLIICAVFFYEIHVHSMYFRRFYKLIGVWFLFDRIVGGSLLVELFKVAALVAHGRQQQVFRSGNSVRHQRQRHHHVRWILRDASSECLSIKSINHFSWTKWRMSCYFISHNAGEMHCWRHKFLCIVYKLFSLYAFTGVTVHVENLQLPVYVGVHPRSGGQSNCRRCFPIH